jgi:hypothetical protein
MGKSNKGQVQTLTRRERGISVPVQTKKVLLPDGTSGTAHAVDLSNIDVPDRVYEAEAAGAFLENGMIKLMFAQPKLGKGLRSLVILTLTPQAINQLLNLIDGLESPSLKDIAKTVNVEPAPLMEYPTEEPEQTAALRANMAAVAFSGQDACFDFYYSNAFSAAYVRRTNRLHLDPVVRVNTYTSLSLSLFDKLHSFAGQFPPSVKASQENAHG